MSGFLCLGLWFLLQDLLLFYLVSLADNLLNRSLLLLLELLILLEGFLPLIQLFMVLLFPDFHQFGVQFLNFQSQSGLIKCSDRRVIRSLWLINVPVNELIKEVQIFSKQIIRPIQLKHVPPDRFTSETNLQQSLYTQYTKVLHPSIQAKNRVQEWCAVLHL